MACIPSGIASGSGHKETAPHDRKMYRGAGSPDEMRAELYETGTMDQLERLHIQVQIEALESQKLAAAAIVKNSRYMLMSVVMATIATTITAAGLVFNIISLARVLR